MQYLPGGIPWAAYKQIRFHHISKVKQGRQRFISSLFFDLFFYTVTISIGYGKCVCIFAESKNHVAILHLQEQWDIGFGITVRC